MKRFLSSSAATTHDSSSTRLLRAVRVRLGLGTLAMSLIVGGVGAGATVTAQSDERSATAPALFVAIKGYRAFDSRVDYPQTKISDGPVAVSVFVDDDYRIAIPAEAVAVAYTLTATATEGSGYAYVDAYDEDAYSGRADPSKDISTVAWTEAGQRVANSGIVSTFEGDTDGAHFVLVGVDGTDAATHLIIDITGYLIPAT